MKKVLEIIDFKNGSTPGEEYIILKALIDVDLKNYAILDKTFDKEDDESNIYRHFHKLPNKQLNRGETIKIYSGIKRLAKLTDKVAFDEIEYWGSEKCIWNDNSKDNATIIYFEFIDTEKV